MTLSRQEAGVPTGAAVRMPAESLIRLVYGRLDPEHTPCTVATDGVDLATLRRSFPVSDQDSIWPGA